MLWSGVSPALAIVGGTESGGPLARSSIMVLTSNGGVCSAVIIAADVILTAAHCASGADQYRVHYRDTSGAPVMLEPANRVVHPGYVAAAIKTRSRSIDLALFKLKQPLPETFSAATLSSAQPKAGNRIKIGGYGVARSDDGRSSGIFRTAELGVIEPYGPSRLLVWAKDEQSRGACNGDSGGSLALNNSVFAITAWAAGTKQSPCGQITQGILLGPQRKWIDETLGKWGRQALWQD